MEIPMTDAFAKIKPTDSFKLAKQAARRNQIPPQSALCKRAQK
jgi:hypothetical protein